MFAVLVEVFIIKYFSGVFPLQNLKQYINFQGHKNTTNKKKHWNFKKL